MQPSPLPQGRWALVNGRVVLPDEVVTGQAVIIDANRIVGITPEAELSADVTHVDVGGRLITPGLLDIHIHGAVGHSFNEPSAAAWQQVLETTAQHGVTSLLATIGTAALPLLLDCLSLGATWMSAPTSQNVTQVIGVHLEGPYFAYAQRGAQDPNNLRTPDDGSMGALLEHHHVMKVMSFAPELSGALELTDRLVKLGIVAAAGHSSATDTDVMAAMQHGLRHTIHIWSGQSTTIRQGPWRKPGLLEATLALDGLTAEMITDNRHLPPTLMKLAYKCLGADRLAAISDATNGAGLPEGTHFTMGDMTYDVHDGVAMMLDRTAFAGSSTLLNQMLPILVREVGVPLHEAVRMCTMTPARIIGVDASKGSLAAGKNADIAIFEDDFTAWGTMVGGRWVYTTTPLPA